MMNPRDCIIDPKHIADIPHATIDERYVDGKDMLRKFPGHYVVVRREHATYHVSKPGFNCLPDVVLVSSTPIYKDGYDPDTMANYRNNTVYDFLNNKAYVFDYNGDYRIITLTEGE